MNIDFNVSNSSVVGKKGVGNQYPLLNFNSRSLHLRSNIHKPNKRNLGPLLPGPLRHLRPGLEPLEPRLLHDPQAPHIRLLDNGTQPLRDLDLAPVLVLATLQTSHRERVNGNPRLGPGQPPPSAQERVHELRRVARAPVLLADHVPDLGPPEPPVPVPVGAEDAAEPDQLARRREADGRVERPHVAAARRQERVQPRLRLGRVRVRPPRQSARHHGPLRAQRVQRGQIPLRQRAQHEVRRADGPARRVRRERPRRQRRLHLHGGGGEGRGLGRRHGEEVRGR